MERNLWRKTLIRKKNTKRLNCTHVIYASSIVAVMSMQNVKSIEQFHANWQLQKSKRGKFEMNLCLTHWNWWKRNWFFFHRCACDWQLLSQHIVFTPIDVVKDKIIDCHLEALVSLNPTHSMHTCNRVPSQNGEIAIIEKHIFDQDFSLASFTTSI